jgi:hypothetical protein
MPRFFLSRSLKVSSALLVVALAAVGCDDSASDGAKPEPPSEQAVKAQDEMNKFMQGNKNFGKQGPAKINTGPKLDK